MKAVGYDDQGETIWELTEEETQQWRQQFAPAEAAAAKAQGKSAPASQEPAREPESAPGAERQISQNTEAGATSPQAMELGSKIWEMRKRGLSTYEVHRRLGIPLSAVEEILQQFQRNLYPDVGQMLEHYRALDDQRLEELIRRWLPVATSPAIEVEKVGRNGRTYIELDTGTPAKAAGVVLGAIAHRIKLLAACRPESSGSGGKDILVWLQSCLPKMGKLVEEVDGTPVARERLVLETEAEAEDLAPERINSNGSNR